MPAGFGHRRLREIQIDGMVGAGQLALDTPGPMGIPTIRSNTGLEFSVALAMNADGPTAPTPPLANVTLLAGKAPVRAKLAILRKPFAATAYVPLWVTLIAPVCDAESRAGR